MACQRCGECCRKVGFIVQPQKKMLDLLVAHGLIKDGDKQLKLTVWHDCQHLVWDGEFASCAIYDDRPEFCSDFLCPRARGGGKIQEARAMVGS